MSYIQQILPFLSRHGGLVGCLALALLLLSVLKIRRLKKHMKAEKDSHWRELRDCRNALDDSREHHSALNSKIYGLQSRIAQLEEDNEIFSKENRSLKKKLKDASKTLETLENKQSDKAAFSKRIQKRHEEADSLFEHSTSSLIRPHEPRFLYKEERHSFYHIRQELATPKYSKKYGGDLYVFPQVALHSVFDVTETATQYDSWADENYVKRMFLSKSVDFLVCVDKKIIIKDGYTNEDGTKRDFSEHMYVPILAIEIDGPYHETPDQKQRDHIKDLLFQSISLPLLRFPLEKNKTDKTAIRQRIQTMLLPESETP